LNYPDKELAVIPQADKRPQYVDVNASFCAVYIENRFDYAVIDSIVNARKNLPLGTVIYVVTSQRLVDSFRKLGDRAGPLVVVQDLVYLEHASKKTEPYSLLLTSEAFWQAFTTDYVLIFQRDSRFCARSRRKLTDFVGRFDYIGAPWAPVFAKSAGFCVGNGGLSLRKRSAMLQCIRAGIKERHPEDVAFVKCLLQDTRYRLPTCVEAANFAVESYHAGVTPVGVHAARGYQKDTFLGTQCPEIYLSPR